MARTRRRKRSLLRIICFLLAFLFTITEVLLNSRIINSNTNDDGFHPTLPVPRKGIERDFIPFGSKISPRPKLTDKFLNRFIIVPEYKLMFCYVEKTGCSMFNHLFRILRLHHPSLADNTKELMYQANDTWYRNTPEHHGLKKSDLEDMLQNPEWTKAVFYRHPLTRYLSAFRSKCEGWDWDGWKRCVDAFGFKKGGFAFVLNALLQNQTRAFNDPHFSPMSRFCGGLDNTLDYYDVVHRLSTNTTPPQIEKCGSLNARV